MVMEEIKETIAALGRRFGDRRVCYFEVEVREVQAGACELRGRVLDEETLQAVREALGEAFPAVTVRTDEIAVLRKRSPRMMTVATNLTNLKGRPTNGSETLNQLVAGWTVEWLHEEDGWVLARQPDGYLGWLAARYMTEEMPAAATHLVAAPVAMLYEEAGAASKSQLVSRLVAGTAVTVGEVKDGWGHVALPGFKHGWLRMSALRACEALPGDEETRRAQVVEDAQQYIGVPYLWGGISVLGIDCSGFVQLLHRLSGVTIARDADMQWGEGETVEPPFAPGDLLFFGSGQGRRRITHVGMSVGGWRIIHSSGPRNGVYVDDVQAVDFLRDSFVSACSFLSGVD